MNPVLKFAHKYAEGFLSLFYPNVCAACGSILSGSGQVLCTWCMHSLPETGYNSSSGNPVEELFYGRLPVEHAFALLFFDKGSKYRRLVYQLKYSGRKENGTFLGRLIGTRLKESVFGPFDLIIPVPLHRKKLRKRGFNQSAVIAYGISSVLNTEVSENILKRKIFTPTQTRKGRYHRWKNVEGIFECANPSRLENKHVLLVDDVVTTGSTLEAAGTPLLCIEGLKLSVAAAAYSTT